MPEVAPRLFSPDSEPVPTVSAIVDAYLAHVAVKVRSGRIKPPSLDRARYYLSCFARDFGHKLIPETRGARGENWCRQSDLTAWIADHSEWESDHTKAGALTQVIAAFHWAERDELIGRNPYHQPKDLHLVLRPRDPMTRAQFRAVVSKTYTRPGHRKPVGGIVLRVALRFLWRTGARPCEMRESLWTDLDWSTGIITLVEHKTARSAGVNRLIALDCWTVRMLRCIEATQHKDAIHIFLNSRRKPWKPDAWEGIFRSFADRAGLPLSCSSYGARHAYCLRKIDEGLSDRNIADLLGHSSVKLVGWYGRQSRQRAGYLHELANRGREPRRDT